VDERGGGSSHDLEESVQELSSVVEVLSTGVDLLNITSDNRLLALGADDILVDTVEENELEGPPHVGTGIPGLVGLGADHGLVPGRVLGLRFLGSSLSSDLLAVSSLKIFAESSTVGVAALLELLSSKVTLVEVADNTLEVGGSGRDRTAAEEEGTLNDVVGLELPVLLDDDTVHPWDEKDGHQKTPTGTGSNDNTGNLLLGEVDLIRATLPEKKHDNERGSEPEVEGDKDKTANGRALSEEDGVFGEHEEGSGEDTGQHRSNDPSEEDL